MMHPMQKFLSGSESNKLKVDVFNFLWYVIEPLGKNEGEPYKYCYSWKKDKSPRTKKFATSYYCQRDIDEDTKIYSEMGEYVEFVSKPYLNVSKDKLIRHINCYLKEIDDEYSLFIDRRCFGWKAVNIESKKGIISLKREKKHFESLKKLFNF